MKKIHLLSILTVLLLYSLLSFLIDKTYILPSLIDIFKSLISIIIDPTFLSTIFITIFRSLIGLLISFILALVLALIAYYNDTFKDFFNPIYILLKTIPNITYIIVCLLWFGRNISVLIICMLVVFPILYNSLLNALAHIDPSLIKATRLYQITYLNKCKKIYLPLIKKDIFLAISNACSLGFKVSIMAEILAQTKIGIGKELYYAKANFMMADIFAWTIIIIVISYLFDFLINYLNKKSD